MRLFHNFKTLFVIVSTMVLVGCSCSTAKDSLSKVKQDADKEINKLIDQKAEMSADKMDGKKMGCLLYTSPSPRDATLSRMPSSA